jgi:hypothetical protein
VAALQSGFDLVHRPKDSEGCDLNGLDFWFAPLLIAQISREFCEAGNGRTIADTPMNARLKSVI